MTKFEQIGVNIQCSSMTPKHAKDNINMSCRICCERGMRGMDCDRCAIVTAHNTVMAAFETILGTKEDKPA